MRINAFTVEDIPLITKDHNIAKIICSLAQLDENDIVVVASTIVSKVEGRIIDPEQITPTLEAIRISKQTDNDPKFVQAVLDECTEVLLESPIFLVRHTSGNICINAGVDESNVENGLLLLPTDPDESAKKLKDDIFMLTKKHVSVIITDTNGRAFREGQTGIALGVAGINTHHDWRGSSDLFGTILEVANEAVVDEIAGFANCMMGEGNWGTPVVVIRGFELLSDGDGMNAMYRPPETDIISNALQNYKWRP
ncbi:MAG: coenzyme F420-0:L-glutamate ligase [Methanosarcinales archaeon]|nr:coenzyme F420-0:L-glutamate ligase [Methanosarcinales archaeon]